MRAFGARSCARGLCRREVLLLVLLAGRRVAGARATCSLWFLLLACLALALVRQLGRALAGKGTRVALQLLKDSETVVAG